MKVTTPPQSSLQDAANGLDPSALTRRELQYLARELELCRGNAKSDVIIEHIRECMSTDDGVRVVSVLRSMRGQRPQAPPCDSVTPRTMAVADDATPSRRSSRSSPRSDTIEASVPEYLSTNQQTSTSPIERKMSFVINGHEEPAEVVNEASMAAKHEKTPVAQGHKAETSTKKKISEMKSEAPMVDITVLATDANTTLADKEKTPSKKEMSSTEALDALDTGVSGPVENFPAKHPVAKDQLTSVLRRSTPVKNGRSPLANMSNLTLGQKPKLASSDVEALLRSADDLVAIGSDRVKCTTTGHEMKADADVISAYLSGKRYQRAHNQKTSFAQFEPMFVRHPDEKQSHLLWCNVTQTSIARNVERVEAHIKGARYQKELPVWQADQAALVAAKEATEKNSEEEKDAAPPTSRKRKVSISQRHHPNKVARGEAI